MKRSIGKQYDKDDPFKKKARLHQSKIRSEILQVNYDEYGNRLTEHDAKLGLNFYRGFNIFDEVKKRYPAYSKGLYADMLRSEHIPFNVFIPLKKNLMFATEIFIDLLSIEMDRVTDIKVEYAPSPSIDYLNDRTAFDTYVEYVHKDMNKGIIGIEVKYTEQDYKLKRGSKEEADINDATSPYWHLTKKLGLFKQDKISELPKDRYRQIWRNQLLGESILNRTDSKYAYFTSVILYPAGNGHFTEVSQEYSTFLTIPDKQRFTAITFETLFKLVEEKSDTNELKHWISYLYKRYIV
ncbi:MAG: hypothetical protein PHE86_05245 [Candidatus Marinimicrobia bacterium]|nr:hypothetical protein [Candidatus Neomarinimicrobiota bacterium]